MTFPDPKTSYRKDPKGRLVPETLVSPADRLIDQTVRTIYERAQELSTQIAHFKSQAYADINATLELLTERYGAKIGGPRGNLSLTSFDARLRLTIAVQDRVTFGPELQVAKSLIDRCIAKWSDGARPEICALVEDAFQVSHEGKLNREALLRLRRLAIEDPDWQAAMTALGDSIRVVGSQEYLRLHHRADPRARWEQLRLDMTRTSLPEEEAAA